MRGSYWSLQSHDAGGMTMMQAMMQGVISARVNSLTRSKPALGLISFLKDYPIWAAANGSLPPFK